MNFVLWVHSAIDSTMFTEVSLLAPQLSLSYIQFYVTFNHILNKKPNKIKHISKYMPLKNIISLEGILDSLCSLYPLILKNVDPCSSSLAPSLLVCLLSPYCIIFHPCPCPTTTSTSLPLIPYA